MLLYPLIAFARPGRIALFLRRGLAVLVGLGLQRALVAQVVVGQTQLGQLIEAEEAEAGVRDRH